MSKEYKVENNNNEQLLVINSAHEFSGAMQIYGNNLSIDDVVYEDGEIKEITVHERKA